MCQTKLIVSALLSLITATIGCNLEDSKHLDREKLKSIEAIDDRVTDTVDLGISDQEEKKEKSIEEILDIASGYENERQLDIIVRLAGELEDTGKMRRRRDLRRLYEELIKRGKLDIISKMEERLKGKKRRILWTTVARLCRSMECKKLRKEWAIQNPESIGLLQFHPNGKRILEKKFLDERTNALERASCIQILGIIGDLETIKNIEKYKDDKTKFLVQSMEGDEDIGYYVRKAIKKINKRNKANAEDKD